MNDSQSWHHTYVTSVSWLMLSSKHNTKANRSMTYKMYRISILPRITPSLVTLQPPVHLKSSFSIMAWACLSLGMSSTRTLPRTRVSSDLIPPGHYVEVRSAQGNVRYEPAEELQHSLGDKRPHGRGSEVNRPDLREEVRSEWCWCAWGPDIRSPTWGPSNLSLWINDKSAKQKMTEICF